MGRRRKYGPGIGMQSKLGYAGRAAMALTRDTVAANNRRYSFSTGARMTGAEMMDS